MAGSNNPMARFADGKAQDAMRTIGEVSTAFGIKPHVLRYWEQQFPMLQPLKRSGGRRLYRAEDIALIDQIDKLVNKQGYTLKGANMALKRGLVPDASEGSARSAGTSASGADEGDEMIDKLKSIRSRLSKALAE